ncbi:MAG: DUF2798 domain-containing protein [Sphingorhabdus sp.]
MPRERLLLMFFMTLLMGLILSAVFTWQTLGFMSGFIAAWASRFVSTYIIVLPTVLIVSPIAQCLAVRADNFLAQRQNSQTQKGKSS